MVQVQSQPAPVEIRLNYKYQFLWETPRTRYVLITGGRGSGKSFGVSFWLCDALKRYAKWRALYTRYTMVSAHISIIPEFTQKMDLLAARSEYHVTTNEISHKLTGSDVLFSGIKTSSGNQTAKLKSIPGVNVFIVDEGEEFVDPDSFDTIDFSIRQEGVPNLIIIIMNPSNITHWIWGRWFENSRRYEVIDGIPIPISTHPDVTHLHTSYLDNLDNLNPSFLHQLQQVRQEHLAQVAGGLHPTKTKYARKIIGAWAEAAEGTIYNNWIEGPFDTSLPYVYGMDDGYTDPLAMVKVAVNHRLKLIYVKQALYQPNLGTEQVKGMLGLIERPQDLIVADSENPRLISDLAAARYNITPTKKFPGSVIDGIRKMQDYTLVIDPGSYDVLREVRSYVWHDRKAEIPAPGNDHSMDAIRYAFQYLVSGSAYAAQG